MSCRCHTAFIALASLFCSVLASSRPEGHGHGRDLVSRFIAHIDEIHRLLALTEEATVPALSLRRPSSGTASPPPMPSKWVSFVNDSYIVNGTVIPSTLPFPTGGALPRHASDSDKKRLAQLYHFKFVYAPAEFVGTSKEWFNSTVYQTADFAGMSLNGNKYPFPNKPGYGFRDMFAWVPAAQDGGVVEYKGKRVHSWTLQAPQAHQVLYVDEANIPVFMSLSMGPGVMVNYEFIDFQAGAELPEVWDGFDQEEFKQVVCPEPAEKTVKTMMYIFHPVNQFNISGQDLGDTTGDTFFVCSDMLDGFAPALDHNYAWLTQWEVELVPRWGQYLNCNGYNPASCTGANNFWVGREGSNYIGVSNATERQCGATNALVGAWWSLPEGGRCGPQQQPGDGSCTWRARRVKTIDGKCLFAGDRFKAACQKDGRGPFPDAMVLFLEAFASEDPSQSGCPDLLPDKPAACSWNKGCVGLSGDCCPTVDGSMLDCCAASPSASTNATSRFFVV